VDEGELGENWITCFRNRDDEGVKKLRVVRKGRGGWGKDAVRKARRARRNWNKR